MRKVRTGAAWLLAAALLLLCACGRQPTVLEEQTVTDITGVTGAAPRILCIGDSNTYGYDPRSYSGSRYSETERWTGLLARQGYEVINCGVNGATIPGEARLPEMEALVSEHAPVDAIVVMLGTNDLCIGIDAEQSAAAMERLLNCLQTAAPAAKLILIAPPPMNLGDRGKDIMDEGVRLTEAYAGLAERLGIGFADAGAWEIALGDDGVHFLPEGHAAFAAGLGRLLTALFADRNNK